MSQNLNYRNEAWLRDAYARLKTTGVARECDISLGVVSYWTECWALSNLQPLDSIENIRKGAAVV